MDKQKSLCPEQGNKNTKKTKRIECRMLLILAVAIAKERAVRWLVLTTD